MIKALLLFVILSPLGFSQFYDISGQDEIIPEEEEANIFFRDHNFISPNFKKSHFFMNLETTVLMYKNDFFFDGVEAQVRPTDSLPLVGPSLGIGYRFKLGSFSTSSHFNFFHFMNRDRYTGKASEELPVMVSEQENDNSITGLEVAQRFYLTYQLSERNYIEPFVHFGLGFAVSEAKYEHNFYDYINSEYYYSFVREQLLTQNIAVGFNIMNQNGLYFIFKVQKNVLTIGERKTETSSSPFQSGTPTVTETSATVDINSNRDEFSVTLGGGYVF